jgi:hypothetical protein
MDAYNWSLDWLTGFTRLLQLVTTSNNDKTIQSAIYYGTKSSQSTCLYQFSGNSFQQWTFAFPWVPKLSVCLSHTNSQLTLTEHFFLYITAQKDVAWTEIGRARRPLHPLFISRYNSHNSADWWHGIQGFTNTPVKMKRLRLAERTCCHVL